MTKRDRCQCGARYGDFRTGLSFASVRAMLWRPEPPYRNRRRHGVLGFWREVKLGMWNATHGGCR